ncbi:MAG: penicillin acylase family protein [Anaerolineae bacterium]|nr:penicillin acylase family protein [Anaerolineae bacterium]
MAVGPKERLTSLIHAVLGPVLQKGLTWLSRRRLPRADGVLPLSGLRSPVEVFYDRWGVPHIYALAERDLFFAQGFVHARDRLWQMDFTRRFVAGRLSEIFGAQTVPADRSLRVVGMRRVVERELPLLDADVRANLEAYAAGVNACIARDPLPVEFLLLRYEPEPWTVADSLSWSKMIAFAVANGWEAELLRLRLVDCLGPDVCTELRLGDPGCWQHTPLLDKRGRPGPSVDAQALEQAQTPQSPADLLGADGWGSNNWVISGDRTATGAPLLANDMHLALSAPCVWYENHLVCGDMNVTGVTFPGVAGVLAGHNGRVAWGFTNCPADVQDLYVERLRSTKDGGVEYEYKGEWHPVQVVREEIRVRGGETVVDDVVITRHGPIINKLAPDFSGERPLALRWLALQPDTLIEAVSAMDRARNCHEFRQALRLWTVPAQNVVYADVEGDIGYSLAGQIPVRARGNGQVPVPGWTGEYEWTGYIPFEDLPHSYNPSEGYIATANNCTVDDDYPHNLVCNYRLDDRAKRISALIEAQKEIDSAYVQQMHFDQMSPPAQAVGRYLGELHVDDPQLAAIVEMMRDWDGALAADSVAAAVYKVFEHRVAILMLSRRLGDLAGCYLGEGLVPEFLADSYFGERAREWLRETLARPESHWFDLGQGQTRDDAMRQGLRETVDFLKAELGPRVDDWTWGRLHKLVFAHTLGNARLLDRAFNRGPYPVGGDGNTLWSTHPMRYDLSSDRLAGPPFRFIADMGDLRNSLGLLAPGQSGRVGSPHYDDQIEAWFSGAYHPMLYDREDVKQAAKRQLRLEPKLDTDSQILGMAALRRRGKDNGPARER